MNSDENVGTEKNFHTKSPEEQKNANARDLADSYLNVSLLIRFVSGIYSSHLPTRVILNFTKKPLEAKVIQKAATRHFDTVFRKAPRLLH